MQISMFSTVFPIIMALNINLCKERQIMLWCGRKVHFRFLEIITSLPRHNHGMSQHDKVNRHSSIGLLSTQSYSETWIIVIKQLIQSF